jgi:hypothetical protein
VADESFGGLRTYRDWIFVGGAVEKQSKSLPFVYPPDLGKQSQTSASNSNLTENLNSSDENDSKLRTKFVEEYMLDNGFLVFGVNPNK